MALTISVEDIISTTNNPLLQAKPHWTRVRLGDVATVLNGYAFKAELFNRNEGTPLIRIRDVGSDDSQTLYSGEFESKYLVLPGELLIGMDGDFNCARWRGKPSLLNQRVCKVSISTDTYEDRFLDFVLPGYLKAINDATSSITVKHLSSRTIQDIPLPCPPMDEQREIVAEIEKQFSRLDEAVANLKRVKANLKRYKASVLKDAVEGRLVPTEAELARREGRSFETGEQLLQRILEVRRREWRGKRSYREPVVPEFTNLPEVPIGWAWASPDQLSASEPYSLAIGPFGSSLKVSDYTTEGVPLVFVRNIRAVSFGGSETVFVTLDKAEDLKAHIVQAGDILVTKMGAPPGDVCMYPATRPPAVITADCIKLRLMRQQLSEAFFAYAIESKLVQSQIQGITKGVAQLKVSLGNFSSIGFPLPPVAEQRRIVEEIDRRLSLVRSVESEVDANLKRAQALRQSTLSKSFSSSS